MTNDDQYVPGDGDMRWQYVVKRMDDGATRTHAEQEYTRWLAAHDARVRRDAAREALNGLAIDLAVTSGHTEAEEVRDYRDAHYPEESP